MACQVLRCRFVSLHRGHDGLDKDVAASDQLPAGAPSRGGERRGPRVLPYRHACRAARLHRLGKVDDVLLGESLGDLGFQGDKIVDLEGIDDAGIVLGEDEQVEHANGAPFYQSRQLSSHHR